MTIHTVNLQERTIFKNFNYVIHGITLNERLQKLA